MTHLVLFHHAMGLTDGVRAFADEIRKDGHEVATPDLYEGRVFDTLDDGIAHAEQIGMDALLEAGTAAAESVESGCVYAGFSLGALVAHKLAQTREGATGALLYHYGDVPIDTFGPVWPPGLSVQLHLSENDPYSDRSVVDEFIEVAGSSAPAELFVYRGSVHLFTDSSLPGFDAASTSLVLRRTREFLDR